MTTRITVIGSSFAALEAAHILRKKDHHAEITIVAPRPEFIYYPSLIWIPTGHREGEALRVSLEKFFYHWDLRYHSGYVTALADKGRTVVTTHGPINNDGLIIASGGRFIKKLQGMEHAIVPCEGISEAEKLRDKLLTMEKGTIAFGFSGNPQEPAAMRGGPIFEFMLGIDTWLRDQKKRKHFKLVFFSPAAKPGQRLGDQAVEKILGVFKERDIETHLGHPVQWLAADKVVTAAGEIPADLIVFMPGMTGPEWLEHSSLPRSPGGFIRADAHCRVLEHERVYVAGDAGHFPGPDWLPKQGHAAVLQAEAAAINLTSELNGHAPDRTFRPELICILDTWNEGMVIARSPQGTLMLPSSRVWHWSKRLFEWWSLRRFNH